MKITDETARVALRELNILIRESGPHSFPYHGVEDEHMTPLALTKVVIEDKIGRLDTNGQTRFGKGKRAGLKEALNVIRNVGEHTGAEISRIDPLQDDIFLARDELEEITGN